MQKGLLITCPEHDGGTAYLTYFSRLIIDEGQKRSIKIKKVKDENLNLKDFSEVIEKLDYRLIVFNGHGSPDAIFGYKTNIIIKVGKNESHLKERIVYARACDAGQILGPECMKETKNGSFIGYILPFVFFMDEKWTTNPHNDKIARLFLDPSNLVPISMIKGHTSLEAHKNSKRQMLKTMESLLKNNQEQETPFYLEALWNNYNGQVIYGNNSAKL